MDLTGSTITRQEQSLCRQNDISRVFQESFHGFFWTSCFYSPTMWRLFLRLSVSKAHNRPDCYDNKARGNQQHDRCFTRVW